MTRRTLRTLTALPAALLAALGAAAFLALVPAHAASNKPAKVEGYLEFRKGEFLIVDAQRLLPTSKTRFRGSGKAKHVPGIPLGYEIKASGTRQPDGTIVLRDLEARRNGKAFLEEDVLAGTNKAEQAYVKAAKVFNAGPDGKEKSLGALHATGPGVDRARRIVDRLLPAYIDPKSVRVYVVDNKEWNAMAMANFSIYVFSGLMADLDDNELAIVLGHEIAHATHEHSRKQAKTGFFSGIAGSVAGVGAEKIDNDLARSAALGATALGVTTFSNVYSREAEDQADRVGLRYVYEAGYDVTKAPRLWKRFAEKYGDHSKVENFFFGSHSLSSERAADLEREIRKNYSDPKKDPPGRTAAKTGAR